MRIRASTFIAVSFLSLMTSCGDRIGLTTADMALRNEYGGECGDTALPTGIGWQEQSFEAQPSGYWQPRLCGRGFGAIRFCSNLGRRG